MKTTYCIGPIKFHLPIFSTGMIAFLLWFFKVDNIWWGIFIAFEVIMWIVVIATIWNQEEININTVEGRRKLRELMDEDIQTKKVFKDKI